MKFSLNRGGASAAENKRSRERGLKDLEAKAKAGKKAEIRRLKQALVLAKKQLRDECRGRKAAAVAGKREVFRETKEAMAAARERRAVAKASLKANLERIAEECQIRIDRVIEGEQRSVGAIQRSIEELATDLRSSALASRQAREREKERPKATAKESRQEQIEAALRDVAERDPSLVDLVRRQARGIVAKPRQTLGEAFLEWLDEHPAEVQAHRAQASRLHPADLMCAQAIHESGEGNPEAKAWAAENCQESGKAKPALKKKASAAERTVDFLAEEKKPAARPALPPELAGVFRNAHFEMDGRHMTLSVPGHSPVEVGEITQDRETNAWNAEAFKVQEHSGPRKSGFASAAAAQTWVKERITADPYWAQWFKVPTKKPAAKGPKGQQGLGIGKFGADFLDAGTQQQRTLGDVVPF